MLAFLLTYQLNSVVSILPWPQKGFKHCVVPAGTREDRKWFSSHTCKVAGLLLLLLLAHPSLAPCSEGTSPGKKRKEDNYRQPAVWEPVAELRQRRIPFQGCCRACNGCEGRPCRAHHVLHLIREGTASQPVTPGLPASSCSRQRGQPRSLNGPMCTLTCQSASHNSQKIVTSGGHWWGFGSDLKTQKNKLLRHTGARLSEIWTISLQISTLRQSWLKSTGLSKPEKGGGEELVLYWNSQWKIKIHTFSLASFTNHRHCRHNKESTKVCERYLYVKMN